MSFHSTRYKLTNLTFCSDPFLQVLTYLNDVEEGGETTFPNIPAVGAIRDSQIGKCS